MRLIMGLYHTCSFVDPDTIHPCCHCLSLLFALYCLLSHSAASAYPTLQWGTQNMTSMPCHWCLQPLLDNGWMSPCKFCQGTPTTGISMCFCCILAFSSSLYSKNTTCTLFTWGIGLFCISTYTFIQISLSPFLVFKGPVAWTGKRSETGPIWTRSPVAVVPLFRWMNRSQPPHQDTPQKYLQNTPKNIENDISDNPFFVEYDKWLLCPHCTPLAM